MVLLHTHCTSKGLASGDTGLVMDICSNGFAVWPLSCACSALPSLGKSLVGCRSKGSGLMLSLSCTSSALRRLGRTPGKGAGVMYLSCASSAQCRWGGSSASSRGKGTQPMFSALPALSCSQVRNLPHSNHHQHFRSSKG